MAVVSKCEDGLAGICGAAVATAVLVAWEGITAVLTDFGGTISVEPHFGHSVTSPAPASAITMFCPHWLQLKAMSILPAPARFGICRS